jgi:hypothetical protein
MVPATSIWPGKPDLYHSYQAVLLPSLPLSPTAATALARARPGVPGGPGGPGVPGGARSGPTP